MQMISEVPLIVSDVSYKQLKAKLHTQILGEIDLESVNRLSDGVARERVGLALRDMLNRERTPLASAERECLMQEILDEVFGLGPLEPLLADMTVSDILVNGATRIYVERHGKLELTKVRFDNDSHLMRIIDRIVTKVGRRIDESTPMVDARLLDGSRVNVVIPPLSLDGPIVSIRRFGKDRLTADGLVVNQTVITQMLELLQGCVKGKLNIMISGGTGAGKTTLLNVLSGYIPETERIVTIEDAAELQLRQQHVVRLETRTANIEGRGAIRQRQLVVNALRMRPDRIVVGEVRGEEAVDMLQAMNTGHEGSLTTIHANTPRDAISRLETMIAMANLNLPEHAVRQQIASAINLIVQVSRMPDGTRKVVSITEVTGMEGPLITTQDIFIFKRTGVDEKRKITGQFQATGIRPKFAEKLQGAGVEFNIDTFFSNQFSR
jgi:pilus assembly protein CpaF